MKHRGLFLVEKASKPSRKMGFRRGREDKVKIADVADVAPQQRLRLRWLIRGDVKSGDRDGQLARMSQHKLLDIDFDCGYVRPEQRVPESYRAPFRADPYNTS